MPAMPVAFPRIGHGGLLASLSRIDKWRFRQFVAAPPELPPTYKTPHSTPLDEWPKRISCHSDGACSWA